MDAYTILGVKKGDSKEHIKKTYRKLANQHHPDKGGNTENFKKIQQAYDDIKSGKADKPKSSNRSYNFNSAADIYNYYQQHRQQRQITVQANISIENSVNGGMQVLSIQMVAGEKPIYVNIEIPAGTTTGTTIKYPKMIVHDVDVYVKFNIVSDKIWSVKGLDIYKVETFDFWELINGTTREIKTIRKDIIKLTIPAMTQPGIKMKLVNLGLKNHNNFLIQGNMYVIIASKIPADIPTGLLKLISDQNN